VEEALPYLAMRHHLFWLAILPGGGGGGGGAPIPNPRLLMMRMNIAYT
jgi:hypothetical protein